MALGLQVSLGLGATAGTSGVSSTSATAGASASAAVNTPKLAYDMQAGETIYVNQQGVGLSAWVAYTVAYVFADGNAALIREPGFVVYTGPLGLLTNLRRIGELRGEG